MLPDPQLQGVMTVGHCTLCLWHSIHTTCDLQTTDSGKHINFNVKTQWKMGENHQKLRENDVENSVRTLSKYSVQILPSVTAVIK